MVHVVSQTRPTQNRLSREGAVKFLLRETLEKIKWGDIKNDILLNLKIYPVAMAMVPHKSKSKDFQSILDA